MVKRNPAYRQLDADKVIGTMARLRDRVSERFPGAGLTAVASDLVAVGQEASMRAQALSRPYLGLRILVALVIAGGLAALLWALGLFHNSVLYGEDLQGLDAAISVLLAMGAGAWFLLTLEERWKRARAQRWLHDLRAFAHVIDMHQLTKDPTVILRLGAPTASSPQRLTTEFELARYLEYCAEMLALLGKLAALYAGRSGDHVVVTAAGDIENLCSDLGRKIWQKIMILSELLEEPAGPSEDFPIMDNHPITAPSNTGRDPRTGAPDAGKAPFPGGGADEGGVKTADGGPPSPDSPVTPGGVEGEGESERQADPSLSIESVNGARGDERKGGMIGEGGS